MHLHLCGLLIAGWLLWSRSLTLLLTIHRHPGAKVHHHCRGQHHRNNDPHDVRAAEIGSHSQWGECIIIVGAHGDVRGQGSTEQASIQEALHLLHAEHVVRRVTGFLHGHAQFANVPTRAVKGTQHMEQTNEDWHLNQRGETGSQGIEAHVLLQLAHFQRHRLLVVFVLGPDFLHLGLEFSHLTRGTQLVGHRLNKQNADGEHQKNDCQCPGHARCWIQHQAKRLMPEPKNGRDWVINKVQHVCRVLLVQRYAGR